MTQLVTAYILPFPVTYHAAPLFAQGVEVQITISLVNPVTQEVIDGYDALITAFVMIASTGALAGDSISPWESMLGEQIGPAVSAQKIAWTLSQCRVDERSLVLLVQQLLMLCEQHPISSVEIRRSTSTDPLVALRCDGKTKVVYPPVWPNHAYALTIDEGFYDSPNLYVEFTRELSADEQAQIDGEILAWASAVIMGFYPIAPIPPQQCTMLAEDNVTFIDQELEWHMHKFRAHMSALDGLLNVCTAIDKNIAPISKIRIE